MKTHRPTPHPPPKKKKKKKKKTHSDLHRSQSDRRIQRILTLAQHAYAYNKQANDYEEKHPTLLLLNCIRTRIHTEENARPHNHIQDKMLLELLSQMLDETLKKQSYLNICGDYERVKIKTPVIVSGVGRCQKVGGTQTRDLSTFGKEPI